MKTFATMTPGEKLQAWKRGKTFGRERCIQETIVLEMLCERPTVTLHEATAAIKTSKGQAHGVLSRLADQKLAVLLKEGCRGKEPRPSVWQLRETFERRN